MERTPPEFTAKEVNYFQNTDFLKTKRSIITGFIQLFENIQLDLLDLINSGNFQLPNDVITKSGKITKGENYKGLPFVVLDCPGFFTKNDIFAYRTIFWWGNYLSNHFLLKGSYLDHYRERFAKSWLLLKGEKVYLDLSDDPWNHDLSTREYVGIDQLGKKKFEAILQRPGFLKLSWRMELEEWKVFHQYSLKNFMTLIEVMEP